MKQNYNIPNWLNEQFLVKVLNQNASYKNQKLEITKLFVENATNVGENYTSEMFRVIYSCVLNGEKIEDAKFLVKTRHSNENIHKVFEPYEMFVTEIKMYQTFIPEFEKILKEVGIDVKLAPDSLYCDSVNNILVMEDARLRNYKTGAKDKRFSLKTAKLMLTKLAYFHAASVIYNQRNNNCFANKTSKWFIDCEHNIMQTFGFTLKAFIAEVSEWKGFEQYVPKLTEVQKNYRELGEKIVMPSDSFNCMNHGDLWLNNILLRFPNSNDECPDDVLLIDLQLASWSSPVMDLIYFFYTTLNEEDYQNNLDHLIQFYHSQLAETLNKLQYKAIPTLHQLQIEFTKKYFHAILGGILVKSIIYQENQDGAHVDNMFSTEIKDVRDKKFKSKRFQEELKYLIKLLDQKGVLDVPTH